MESSGALIVSWSFSGGKDHSVLIVGQKKPGKDIDIINAFQGEEAEELYHKLVTRKEV